MLNLSFVQLFSGAFALIVAVASGTYEISKSAMPAEISALRLQVKTLDERVRVLQSELEIVNKSRKPSKSDMSKEKGSPENDELSIRFLRLKNGDMVDSFLDVGYSISGHIPKGYDSFLVIKDPLGQYWSLGTSLHNIHNKVQIGITTDKGSAFEIGVLVTDQYFEIGRPSRVLPQGLAYHSIIVTRN